MVSTQALNLRTSLVCSCGKECKNQRGLKIHRTKMGCLAVEPAHTEGVESGTISSQASPSEPITALPTYEQTLITPSEQDPLGSHMGGVEENPILAYITSKSSCSCGKTFKNPKGLKIHQTKMSCSTIGQSLQRTGEASGSSITEAPVAEPDKTKEEPGPESPHSARSLQAEQVPSISRKPNRIKWPTTNEEWANFDEDLNNILKKTAKGSAEQNLQTM